MSNKKVEIEGSGKHCHVTRETLDVLFGKGFELEVKKELSQPGQYATNQRITVEGPRRSVEMIILGPCRTADQVEVSLTDATTLGIKDVPIRESGDIAGSPGCKLIGPCGEVEIKEGVIAAKRHIHMTPDNAAEIGVTDKQVVKVKVGGSRGLIFDEVVVRVNPEFALYMHVDYDEYNAAAINETTKFGEIIV